MANVQGRCKFSFSSNPLGLFRFASSPQRKSRSESKAFWGVLWFPGAREKQTFSMIQKKLSVDTQHLFFLWGLSWIFLVWAIAEERFPSNLSMWQLKELWRALDLSSGPSSVFWSHAAHHCEEDAFQCLLLGLLHGHWQSCWVKLKGAFPPCSCLLALIALAKTVPTV